LFNYLNIVDWENLFDDDLKFFLKNFLFLWSFWNFVSTNSDNDGGFGLSDFSYFNVFEWNLLGLLDDLFNDLFCWLFLYNLYWFFFMGNNSDDNLSCVFNDFNVIGWNNLVDYFLNYFLKYFLFLWSFWSWVGFTNDDFNGGSGLSGRDNFSFFDWGFLFDDLLDDFFLNFNWLWNFFRSDVLIDDTDLKVFSIGYIYDSISALFSSGFRCDNDGPRHSAAFGCFFFNWFAYGFGFFNWFAYGSFFNYWFGPFLDNDFDNVLDFWYGPFLDNDFDNVLDGWYGPFLDNDFDNFLGGFFPSAKHNIHEEIVF